MMRPQHKILHFVLYLFPLLLFQPAQATWVEFTLQMSEEMASGNFDSTIDSLHVHASYSSWQAGPALVAIGTNPESLYQGTANIDAGWHAFKFVIHHSDGSLTWEADPNRFFLAEADSLQLEEVFFSHLDPSCMAAPTSLLFQVDMSAALATHLFDPDRDRLVLMGGHPRLGAWTSRLPMIPGSNSIYELRVEMYVGEENMPYKFVLESLWQPDELRWEAGNDRMYSRSCNEIDSDGDGYLELDLNPELFNHRPDYAPRTCISFGVDNSHVPRSAADGAVWTDGLGASHADEIFYRNGFKIQRLRLWHSPSEAWHGLDSTLAHARFAKELGYEIMLDLHYSDTWADPGHQSPPVAWQGLAFDSLVDSLGQYTESVLRSFIDADVRPAYVQIGNEINAGLLWPYAQVGSANETPELWQNLNELLDAGIQAVRTVQAEGAPIQVILHLALGGQNQACRAFLESLYPDLDYDVIGLSHYPIWHGNLLQLEFNLNDLALRYEKHLLLVETAFPYTTAWGDGCHNFFGESAQLLQTGFAVSEQGQLAYLNCMARVIAAVPNELGLGLCLWEPAILPDFPCSPNENLSLFDFSGQGLAALALPLSLSPAAVSDLRIHVWNQEIELSWSPVSSASAYRIESSLSATGPWATERMCTECSYRTQLVTPSRFYRVIALACNSLIL
jgi:arabinogalactan endo-1,4-beta-galactosidase